jgi:hypothetical protein
MTPGFVGAPKRLVMFSYSVASAVSEGLTEFA